MTEAAFTLTPFPDSNLPNIQITGRISRNNNLLLVHYSLAGSVETILFPEPSMHPARKDDLWKATCLEFFVALPNQPQYWEFNMSPSGDWNIYRMDDYRRVGFREELLIEKVPFTVSFTESCFSMDVTIDISPIIQPEKAIQVGIANILQTRDHHETYWALAHPNPQADFHLRNSFILEL